MTISERIYMLFRQRTHARSREKWGCTKVYQPMAQRRMSTETAIISRQCKEH